MPRVMKTDTYKDWCIDVYMMKSKNPNYKLHATMDSADQVNSTLLLIKKHNKEPIRLIQVKYKGEVVKEWRNLNIGT